MSAPVVCCAPMAMEARALTSGGLPGDLLVRTGVGPRRTVRSAASGRLAGAGAVALAGIAGGLDPRLRPGDIVVADEVRGPDGSAHRLPGARFAAAHLRGRGLTAHVGPVLSSARLVGPGRERLAAGGALAVDMESAWLLGGHRPELVVRVVADPAGDRLLSPATLGRVRTSLRTLRQVVPTLVAWADALAPREVLLAGPRSFCAGVERAVETVERALDQYGAPLYVRKQIVHNQHVVGSLQERGAVFVDDLAEVPSGSTVVFSAHGVAPQVWEQARARDLRVVDATCPLVSKVHTEVRRFGDRGDTVVFIGHAGHEETEGTMGERPERTVLVETPEGARTVDIADPEHVTYLVQTTLAAQDVEEIVGVLRERFPAIAAPPSDDICYATTNRQEALAAVARDADLVLVVGSANSSNSRRLVETAERHGTLAHLVDGVDDVDLEWLAGARTVGLTAGASAPDSLVDEVVDALTGLGPVRVRSRQTVTENVRFTLPKEVRTA